jgi:hypothetical protein
MKEYWMPYSQWCAVCIHLEENLRPTVRPYVIERWLKDEYGLKEVHQQHGFTNYKRIGLEDYYLYEVTDERLFTVFLLRWS